MKLKIKPVYLFAKVISASCNSRPLAGTPMPTSVFRLTMEMVN